MKHKSFIASVLVLTGFFVACNSNDDSSSGLEQSTFSSIQKDIKNKNYASSQVNPYGSSSKTLAQFCDTAKDFVVEDKVQSVNSRTIAAAEYKQAVKDFYVKQGFDSVQVGLEYDRTLTAIDQYSDYKQLLSDYVSQRKITNEQKELIISYIDVYTNATNYNDFVNQTNTYIYHVNKSNYNADQKRMLLTIFDGFSANRDLIEKGEEYSFLQITQNIPNATGKPSLSTQCAGNMLVGMLAGSLGGPAGFVAGFAGGLWSCYKDGCFD